MRTLTALSLALAVMAGATAHAAVDGRGAKAVILKALQRSSKVADKTGPFKTKLGGKTGDRLRPFTASNIRTVHFGGGHGHVGSLHSGGSARGTIDMRRERVRINSYVMVR
jgi:hypothetical protein